MKLNWKIVLLSIIIFVGIFARVYNFGDWLVLKSDQVRDTYMVKRSFDGGPGELPLLGPRAAGTVLRLGPIFYYFQYASSLVAGSIEPPVMAYPNLIFSILAIPLFYFLLRKFFSLEWSLAMAGLFSVSYVAIEYSRFAWNPNSIPFFNLLYFYALLELFNREKGKKMIWTAVAAISLAISSQLHFTSFIGLPIFTLIFFVIRFKDAKQVINLKKVLLFFGLIILIYLPVIFSDIVNQGDNLNLFFKSISNKSSDNPIVKNIYKDSFYFGKYFLRILAGYIEYNKIWYLISAGFIGLGFLANLALIKDEKDPNRKNFLYFSAAWLVISFLLYIPLATKIDKPRFFLPIIMIPFIHIGFLGHYLMSEKRTAALKYVFGSGLILLFLSNAFFVHSWFNEFDRSTKEALDPETTVVLKGKGDRMWWLWWHFREAANYISSDCKNREIYYAMPKKAEEYTHQIEFSLEYIGEKRPIHIMAHKVDFDSGGCYYYISKTGSPVMDELDGHFNFWQKKQFGDLEITRFDFFPGQTATVDLDKPKIKKTETAIQNQSAIVEPETASEPEVIQEEENKESDKEVLKRKPRVYWKDVLSYFFGE